MSLSDPIKGVLSPFLAEYKSKGLQEGFRRKSPAMREHEYDVARRSMLGRFSSQPPVFCQPCIANEKAARRQARLDLVNRALVTCPDHGPASARLRRDMDEVENMRCAKHVYLANDPTVPADLRDNPPPGFFKATSEDLAAMGLEKDLLSPIDSNFRAAVYMKDPVVWGDDPSPKAVVAFRGSTPAKEDWDNNFRQDANLEASYYRDAVNIGNSLAERKTDAYLVGHSLGGGLASAAQGGSGLRASTYNAAGLHPETVARYSRLEQHKMADPERITAIRLQGEVLTKTQESGIAGLLANKAVGRKRDLVPSHDQTYFDQLRKDGKADKGDDYATYLHGMDEVIDSMEQQKSADETALAACLSRETE